MYLVLFVGQALSYCGSLVASVSSSRAKYTIRISSLVSICAWAVLELGQWEKGILAALIALVFPAHWNIQYTCQLTGDKSMHLLSVGRVSEG